MMNNIWQIFQVFAHELHNIMVKCIVLFLPNNLVPAGIVCFHGLSRVLDVGCRFGCPG